MVSSGQVSGIEYEQFPQFLGTEKNLGKGFHDTTSKTEASCIRLLKDNRLGETVRSGLVHGPVAENLAGMSANPGKTWNYLEAVQGQGKLSWLIQYLAPVDWQLKGKIAVNYGK